MFYITSPKKEVEEMKSLAQYLTSYTPPLHPRDADISWLKSREICVDGIKILTNYSIADHGDLKPCILTMSAKNMPFLPFTIVCKVAKMFLGTEELTLYEYTKDGSKIYSWMLLLRKNKPVCVEPASDKVIYHDFIFYRGKTDEGKTPEINVD